MPLGLIAGLIAEQGLKIKAICCQDSFYSTILPMHPVPMWMYVKIPKEMSQSFAYQQPHLCLALNPIGICGSLLIKLFHLPIDALKKTTPKLTGLKQFIVIIFYTTVGQTFGQDAAGKAHVHSVISGASAGMTQIAREWNNNWLGNSFSV